MRMGLLLFFIGLGGGCGAIARHLLSQCGTQYLGLPDFLAVMMVNVIGCFLIGFIFILIAGHYASHRQHRMRETTLADPLIQRGWWPSDDPTTPTPDLLRRDRAAQCQAGFWITGMLGGMTTFSSFSLISLHLSHHGHWALLAANVIGSVVVGWLAVMIGLRLGRSILLRRNHPPHHH